MPVCRQDWRLIHGHDLLMDFDFPEPQLTFPRRRTAAMLLAGAMLFWGSWAVVFAAAVTLAASSPFVHGPVIVLLLIPASAGYLLIHFAQREINRELTGERLWPWRDPGQSTLWGAAMPATLAAAGRAIGLPGRLTVALCYLLLFAGEVCLILLALRT
jgi:hypothetical protein